jgi:Ricin-type beta-trefoil lectin domain
VKGRIVARPIVAVLAGAVTAFGLVVPAASAGAAVAARATGTAASARSAALPAGVQRACPVSAQPGVASCAALVSTKAEAANTKGAQAKGNAANAAATAPVGYAPSDLQSAYGLQSATQGMRQTVAIIVAYDDPTASADLATYRSQYSLPACTTANGCFQQVDLATGSAPVSGWAEEASEDMDVVSAVCPNCHILLVEAAGPDIPDLGTAVDTAVSDGADFVDNGYYTPESASETSYDSYYSHPGVAITAAAGDGGFGVSYPAASPDVTAVGGTVLTSDTSVARGWAETAWPFTGSGCSTYEAKPTWQTTTACTTRMDNDVSAVAASASSETPVAVYDSYEEPGWMEAGGTAVASALVAGVYALAGTPTAGSNPASYPYNNSHLLNDVTSGSNGTCSVTVYCNAGTGYDGPTGNGTPASVIPFTSGGNLSGTFHEGTPGMCLDDTNNSIANDNPVQIWTCNGDAAQRWTAEPDGTIQKGGKCLDLAGGSTAAKTALWLYTCNGASSQQWRPRAPGNLENVASGLCLDTKNGGTTNGTPVWIWTCNAAASQKWSLPYAVPTSTGPIHSGAAASQCLDTANGATSDGTLLWIYSCNGSSTQNWTIESDGTIQSSGKCMDVKGNVTTNAADIDLYPCNGGDQQQWLVQADGALLNPQSGRCVDLSDNGSTANDTDVWIFNCTSGSATQEWTLPPVS